MGNTSLKGPEIGRISSFGDRCVWVEYSSSLPKTSSSSSSSLSLSLRSISSLELDWACMIMCIEADCDWVKALDQQFDPRLDGSDHSLLNPWVDVDFGLGVSLELVVGESGSLKETDTICWVKLEVFFLVRLGLSLANDLSVSPPSGALIIALSNASTLHTSHCHHGHTKSATLVLENHSKGPEALQHFVKDDLDMPSVGISQNLTWKHLEKKLTKSFRLEIPDFGSLNLKQSEKETHSPTPKPNSHPCAIDSKLIELNNNKKSHCSPLRRAPSANGAFVGSAISSSFLINGKKPSTPDQQLAHSFSAPPSPSPDIVDMRTHGKVVASDLGFPMDMVHTCCLTSSNNVSLTWQQAIMHLPPKLHNSLPLHSSSTDAHLELLEELKPCKKKHTVKYCGYS
ncbi:hypothetical protein PPACK8108_LOCUS6579 [Phakopsora pachyrhizi]|uniref:Uncharacterized protein n=1 Tax=Phakopsora pachyrhizi TaxID=170000 RepID=A0AAV0ASW2_PHAPC|nr:hypothetical protein PPACK8108_LOCUS6579 [Phakopsora pachyrhizi]